MYTTCFLFLIIWIAYAWAWKEFQVTPPKEMAIQIEAPIFQQNCKNKKIPCINDCSFLCIEKESQCIGGVCQPTSNVNQITCSQQTGGVPMMVKHPVPHWVCVCTDSRFYGGKACDELHPDVCEHGTFFYLGRRRNICICPPPYELIKIDSKPHCVEKKMLGFYDETTMNRNIL